MPLDANSDEQLPLVTVIMPIRNEASYIAKSLGAVLAQDYPGDRTEILVVDGMSEDGTREIIQNNFVADPRIRVMDNPCGIVPCALNIGVRAARGQIIVRMDAHTEYASDYLKQCVLTLKETGADDVGGPHRAKGGSVIQRAIVAAHHSPFAVGGALSHDLVYEGYVDTVIYGCWYKDTLMKVGLFDEELVRNQDDELNYRIIQAGGKIWQSPRIRSWYYPRSSLRALFRQYLQYGYWKVRVIQKHRLPAAWRHLVPGLFILLGLIDLVLLPWVAWAPLLLMTQISVYALANLAVAFSTAQKWGWKLLPIMPSVFACFHFGYGLGFLKGLLDFIILRRSPSQGMKALTR
jgi:glycosyltransferase involved in cell wall biosynthesis